MKREVRRSFSLAAEEYDSRALLQLSAGRRLVRRLEFLTGVRPLLDLGSGTGRLTPEGGFCLDIALDMVRKSKERGRGAVCGDAEALPLKGSSFKAVISNFALQWTDLEKSFREVYRVLQEGGYFLLSIPVEGSLRTLFRCWRKVGSSLPLFKFPREEEVFEKFKEFFEVVEFERFTVKKKFKSAKEAVKAVTGVGARNPFGRPKRRELLKFLEFYSKEPVVEYRVLIVTGRKG